MEVGERAAAHAGGTGSVTLVEGSTFCLSDSTGDVLPGRAQGLFVADTRVVSAWQLVVDGAGVEPLSDVIVRNVGAEPTGLRVDMVVDADFADLFEVKESRGVSRCELRTEVGPQTMSYTCTVRGDTRSTQVTVTGEPLIRPGLISYEVVVPARGEWSACLSVQTAVDGRAQPPHYRCGEPVDDAAPARRLRAWRLASPRVSTPDTGLTTILRASTRDLGALQIHDPDHPRRRIVAAGAPWFMALFGRDALLTSWMALPLDQRLALGTLQTLARYQGEREDPRTEEQPDRILHEVRLGRAAALALGGGRAYYGSVDATPLFVAPLGELHRWGMPTAEVLALLPAADRALAWIEEYGDLDGDGFVEYRRATDSGLVNQGWKDSFDGINDAAGGLGSPPIALAEVQAYVYAAYRARAAIANTVGDTATAAAFDARAARLKTAFDDRFWLPGRGWYAVGLDRDKRPLDALASNMGHCLWSGIVADDKAAAVAAHLVDRPLWSGFGIRTLATTMGAYNPVSYHNGSVWPHDTAIAAAGLARYGFVAEAQQVALGLLDAARLVGGRLPELFCGFDRAEFPAPVPYPTSCSPQAWAAAAPLRLMRALLRFDPDVPEGLVRFAPALPKRMLPLRIENLPLSGARIALDVPRDGWHVEGLPTGLQVDAAC